VCVYNVNTEISCTLVKSMSNCTRLQENKLQQQQDKCIISYQVTKFICISSRERDWINDAIKTIKSPCSNEAWCNVYKSLLPDLSVEGFKFFLLVTGNESLHDYNQCITIACEYGNQDIVEYLWNKYHKHIREVDIYNYYFAAARGNQLPIIDHLDHLLYDIDNNQYSTPKKINEWHCHYMVLSGACEGGHVNLIEQWEKNTLVDWKQVYEWAKQQGHTQVMQHAQTKLTGK
jgi:hypothetical protein